MLMGNFVSESARHVFVGLFIIYSLVARQAEGQPSPLLVQAATPVDGVLYDRPNNDAEVFVFDLYAPDTGQTVETLRFSCLMGNLCANPPAGIVSWWPGDGDGIDAIGVNDLTLSGDTTFAPGVVGQSFIQDGDGDVISAGSPENLKLDQEFTIEAWIKLDLLKGDSVAGWSAGINLEGPQLGVSPLMELENGVALFLSKTGVSAVFS